MNLTMLLTLTVVLIIGQSQAADDLVLNNTQFLIYNYKFHKARIAQWAERDTAVGTYEHELKPDQLWTFEPHPTKTGCYYIRNEMYQRYRLADASQWFGINNEHNFIVTSGAYKDDQLFKLVPSGKHAGYYYIYSCLYTNDRIGKWSEYDDKTIMWSGDLKDDQLWKLVPRFKANLFTDVVFHFNNLQGSKPITRSVSVTTGIKRSTTNTIRNKETYKRSIEASMGVALEGIGEIGAKATEEFSYELEMTFSVTNEQSWAKTETITFTIPAGKNFKVMQNGANFEGKFSSESCQLLTSIKVFESDSAEFQDPDGFIIA